MPFTSASPPQRLRPLTQRLAASPGDSPRCALGGQGDTAGVGQVDEVLALDVLDVAGAKLGLKVGARDRAAGLAPLGCVGP
jgi:hypothetical protein